MIDFNEFNKISTPEWKLKIQADLKGKDYQSLITKTLDNIDIKPFYHFDDYKTFPEVFSKNFAIGQELNLADEIIGRKIIGKSLTKGTDKFIINASRPFDIDRLTEHLDYSKLVFRLDFLDPGFFIKLYHKTKGKSPILLNPIGHLVRTGNWYNNKKEDFRLLEEIKMEVASDYKFIEVDSLHFLNAGANIRQQIAYSLSQAVEYMESLGKDTAGQLIFNMGVGSNYFFEIAKFKIIKYLWSFILNEYQQTAEIEIAASPGMRNKSLLDPYVNILRTSMEMMSAILGGANLLINSPYDKIFKKSNAFSERIARNQLIILKEEAGFNQGINAYNGSYFIEHISNEIAEKSLNLFKDIENSGGIISQLMKGKIQEKIKESADKEQEKFDKGEKVLVGVNKYLNTKEKMLQPEIFPFIKKRKGKTLIAPIISKRLAEEIEKNLLKEQGKAK